ncbi:putative nadh-ubiquinone oxidoreductase kda subunit [Diaporthe ampelina]|uniref:Putative nadh-ubiquinone oxidoreductase kDa subunit n=1 Tax=Diaporthe ampelina TaxID=1214573 RepID=A0A0G2HVN0_9PEZI|nr:putative nadh-ubiquinone oxidoreductase kda subunit [Diaporthe ampelina]
MRGTLRLLASVKPVRFLEPGAPTGLTGLSANQSPRSTLLYLYSSTLDRLRAVPETSLYRQSVEAVTKHRMSLVQSVKPTGYDEWLAKAREILEKHPEHFKETAHKTSDGSLAAGLERDGKFFVLRQMNADVDSRYQEWDGEEDEGPEKEGSRTLEERQDQSLISSRNPFEGEGIEWTDEPKLTIDQVEDLENKIGAGLIEEVIQVAEGELGLIDTIVQSKAWESLEEKPKDGQWVYFERKE